VTKKRNIMWGITFIAAAALILASKLGYIGELSIVGLIITVLLIPVIIINLIDLDFFGSLIPLAIIGIIYDEPLGIENLTPWTLIVIAVLLSLGLNFIIPKRHRWKKKDMDMSEEIVDGGGNEDIILDAKFSGSVKYVTAKNIKNVSVDCSFAGVKIYFDNADINENGAHMNFDLDFAGAELYIPKSWKVIDDVNCILGGVEIKGSPNQTTDRTVTITGKATFSGITIIYL